MSRVRALVLKSLKVVTWEVFYFFSRWALHYFIDSFLSAQALFWNYCKMISFFLIFWKTLLPTISKWNRKYNKIRYSKDFLKRKYFIIVELFPNKNSLGVKYHQVTLKEFARTQLGQKFIIVSLLHFQKPLPYSPNARLYRRIQFRLFDLLHLYSPLPFHLYWKAQKKQKIVEIAFFFNSGK